jgi:hypothetical protein
MSRLEEHACDDSFTQHADTADECMAQGKTLNATYAGFVLTHDKPGYKSINCLSVFGGFEAGCAGCEGCEYWTYFDLASGESKLPCHYQKPPGGKLPLRATRWQAA